MVVAVIATLRECELPLLVAGKVDSAVEQLEKDGSCRVTAHRLLQVLDCRVYVV